MIKFFINVISARNKCNDGTDTCPKDTTKCMPKGDDYYCDCLTGFVLPENVKDKRKHKGACIGKTS